MGRRRPSAYRVRRERPTSGSCGGRALLLGVDDDPVAVRPAEHRTAEMDGAEFLDGGSSSGGTAGTCGWVRPTPGSLAVLVAVVQTPGVSRFFGCTPLGPLAWGAVLTSAAAGTAGAEIVPAVVARLRG